LANDLNPFISKDFNRIKGEDREFEGVG